MASPRTIFERAENSQLLGLFATGTTSEVAPPPLSGHHMGTEQHPATAIRWLQSLGRSTRLWPVSFTSGVLLLMATTRPFCSTLEPASCVTTIAGHDASLETCPSMRTSTYFGQPPWLNYVPSFVDRFHGLLGPHSVHSFPST